jgi:hypothetical protein
MTNYFKPFCWLCKRPATSSFQVTALGPECPECTADLYPLEECPAHDCEFVNNPESGKCDFHEEWARRPKR